MCRWTRRCVRSRDAHRRVHICAGGQGGVCAAGMLTVVYIYVQVDKEVCAQQGCSPSCTYMCRWTRRCVRSRDAHRRVHICAGGQRGVCAAGMLTVVHIYVQVDSEVCAQQGCSPLCTYMCRWTARCVRSRDAHRCAHICAGGQRGVCAAGMLTVVHIYVQVDSEVCAQQG